MEKKVKFGFLIIVGLLVLNMCNTCNVSRKVKEVETNIQIVQDSLYIKTIDSLSKVIEIEGLKAEKRMIQSTDRKMLDVNRAKEIDEKLTKLGSK